MRLGWTSISTMAGLCLSTMLFNGKATADTNAWSTNGPYDASVMAITLHPLDHNQIYIGTVEGAIYHTTNGGANWRPVDDDTLENTVYEIVVHPSGPDTIYAATFKGIFRSNDAGISWNRIVLPSGNSNDYRTLAMNPRNPALLLTGSILAIFKSEDGGQNWRTIPITTAVQDLQFDTFDSSKVYLATESAESGKSIFRSDDAGDSWENIHNNLNRIAWTQDVEIDPIDPNIIYLGQMVPFDSADICLAKTTDGGEHWFDITPQNLTMNYIHKVFVSPSDHNTVFICTYANGLLKSIDGGQTWEPSNSGLTNVPPSTVTIDSLNNILYLGTFDGGIYKSIDGGASWQKISYNIPQAFCGELVLNPSSSDSIWVDTGNGIYFSPDGANSWNRMEIELPHWFEATADMELDRHNSNYLYAPIASPFNYYQGGFGRSTDKGQTWNYYYDGLPLIFHPTRMAISYLGNGQRRIFMLAVQGIFFSDDQGGSWLQCLNGLPDSLGYLSIGISPVDNNVVFIQSWEDNSMYKSVNCGDSWEWLEAGGHGNYIACDPADTLVVYAEFGISRGIFKSTDGGYGWFDINNNLPRNEDFYYVSGVAINPYNASEIYVDSFHKGVFVSYDGGASWNDFSNGLRTGYGLCSIVVDPLDTNRVFLSTEGYSVWSYTKSTSGISDDIPTLPTKLSQNYPNPFNASTVFEYSLEKAGIASIEVFNILGEKVATLYDGYQDAGSHSLVWDATGQPSGVYCAALRADGKTIIKKSLLLK